MSGSATVDLSAAQRATVVTILRANLPVDAKVWVFGSRAAGHAKPYSDLDLAIDAGRPLSLDESAALNEAFSESNLPWKVDLVDWRGIDAGFAGLIEAQRAPLLGAE